MCDLRGSHFGYATHRLFFKNLGKSGYFRNTPARRRAISDTFVFPCISVTSQLGYIAFRLPSELWFCAWFRPGMVFTVPGPNAKTQFGYVTNSVEMFVQRTKNRNLSKNNLGAPRRYIFKDNVTSLALGETMSFSKNFLGAPRRCIFKDNVISVALGETMSFSKKNSRRSAPKNRG